MGDGSGCVMIDGKMQDDATVKQCHVMVAAAKLLAKRDPELSAAYQFSDADLRSSRDGGRSECEHAEPTRASVPRSGVA